jgi:uncharacterized membrane protein
VIAMLERVVETFIAGVELLEAEGRVVRERASRFAGDVALLVAGTVLALLGAITGLVGVGWALGRAIGGPPALAIVGFGIAIVAGGLTWMAVDRMTGRDREHS